MPNLFHGLAALPLLWLAAAAPPPAALPPACDATTPAGQTCSCDVRTLHPLQGAIGMEEVRAKAQQIADKPGKVWRALEEDPIAVVRGPGDGLYIIDHHHGADAWRLAGHPEALCRIRARPPFTDAAQFWAGLEADHLVHLADAQGRPISPAQLPPDLAHMPDDPYRSLAGLLRKERGVCRSNMAQTEFAEFIWADWLRPRLPIPADISDDALVALLPAAITLARSPAAADMPGYAGDKPAGTCAD